MLTKIGAYVVQVDTAKELAAQKLGIPVEILNVAMKYGRPGIPIQNLRRFELPSKIGLGVAASIGAGLGAYGLYKHYKNPGVL